jgi:hypothetical protein
MAFRFTERHRAEYFTDGLTILRGLIPASLIGELRRETDKGREIARQQHGRQTQRLQPVYAYADLDHRPFREFLDLPGLRATVEGILGDGYHSTERMAIFYEPADEAWSTAWHRDWGNVKGVEEGAFAAARDNPRMMNQFNAALYDDHSLWVVPGSHNREDTPEERKIVPDVFAPAPPLPAGLSPVEREIAWLDYTRSMPGAVQIVLCAGDVAFYRASSWHNGNYVPYVKRATLHDSFPCAEDLAWQAHVYGIQGRAVEKATG